MKRWTPLAVSALLLAALAWAGTVNITDTYVFQALFKPWSRTTAQLPTASAWTGYLAYDSTKGALTVSNGTAWVSSGVNVLTGARSNDFPALDNIGVNATCALSNPITVTGAVIGDSCSVANNLGVDGGVGLSTEAVQSCEVTAAGVAKVKLCVIFSDGGSYNLGDAGWFVRVLH